MTDNTACLSAALRSMLTAIGHKTENVVGGDATAVTAYLVANRSVSHKTTHLFQRSSMGRVTLPEASHVSPDVASDAFVVLKTRIPAQATVAEDPHRRLHSTVAASAVVVVVDVNLHSSHCFFSHLFRRGYQYRKDPPAEHTHGASSSRHAHPDGLKIVARKSQSLRRSAKLARSGDANEPPRARSPDDGRRNCFCFGQSIASNATENHNKVTQFFFRIT